MGHPPEKSPEKGARSSSHRLRNILTGSPTPTAPARGSTGSTRLHSAPLGCASLRGSTSGRNQSNHVRLRLTIQTTFRGYPRNSFGHGHVGNGDGMVTKKAAIGLPVFGMLLEWVTVPYIGIWYVSVGILWCHQSACIGCRPVQQHRQLWLPWNSIPGRWFYRWWLTELSTDHID